MIKLAIPGDIKVQRIVKRLGMGYHLAEPITLFHNKVLQLMYERFARDGHFIIMDNGAAEVSIVEGGKVKHLGEPPAFEQVVSLAKRIGADEIILPDRKHDVEWTAKHTIDCAELVSPVMRAICPQGVDESGWYECFDFLEDKIKFHTICVAKIYDRLAILQWLENQDVPERYHVHLLGLGTDTNPDLEFEVIQIAKRFPWVRGIDTAAPIAFAQHDVHVDNYRVHFSYQWGGKFNSVTAIDNIFMIQEWIKECTY